MTKITINCGCGQAGTVVSVSPRVRFRCHCTKCQTVYKSAYADALVFRRGQVRAADPDKIKWIRTMRPSPLIRGLCCSCDQPVLSHLYGALSIIPAQTATELELPPIDCDIYYRTRTEDLNDNIPKSDGVLAAYIALAIPFVRVLASPGRSVEQF